jgi:hypothetical protein
MARRIHDALAALTIFTVCASNIHWRWANDYLAVALAICSGGVVGAVTESVFKKRADLEMRRRYGKDWR